MTGVKERVSASNRTELRGKIDPILEQYHLSNSDCWLDETDNLWKVTIRNAGVQIGDVSTALCVAGLFVEYAGTTITCACLKSPQRH